MKFEYVNNSNKQINYTYYKSNNKSRIDHIIVDINNTSIEMVIENSEINTSDHLALLIKVKNNNKKEQKLNTTEETNEPGKININWQNPRSVGRYEEILNTKLRNIRFNNIMRNTESAKEKIEKYYSELKEAFVGAHDEVVDELYSNKRKRNDWWTRGMTQLKKELKEARRKYKLWKDEESLLMVKDAKRRFRKEQRRCVFVFEEGKN